MKLHVKFEMDMDEEPFREAFHTENAQQTASALKAIYFAKMAEVGLIDGDGIVENISVAVGVVDENVDDWEAERIRADRLRDERRDEEALRQLESKE